MSSPDNLGTTAVGSCANQPTTAEASQPSSYDFGALKALFHHLRAAHEENCVRQHAGLSSTPGVGPRSHGGLGNSDLLLVNDQLLAARYTTVSASETHAERPGSSPHTSGIRSDESIDCQSDTVDTEHIEQELGQEDDGYREQRGGSVGSHRGEGTARTRDSGKIYDLVTDWVSELELEIYPGNVHEGGDTKTGSYFQSVDFPGGVGLDPDCSIFRGVRHGGSFARLVVIKELQPIPDHAPQDAVTLLELALDHQQVEYAALISSTRS